MLVPPKVAPSFSLGNRSSSRRLHTLPLSSQDAEEKGRLDGQSRGFRSCLFRVHWERRRALYSGLSQVQAGEDDNRGALGCSGSSPLCPDKGQAEMHQWCAGFLILLTLSPHILACHLLLIHSPSLPWSHHSAPSAESETPLLNALSYLCGCLGQQWPTARNSYNRCFNLTHGLSCPVLSSQH